MPPQFIPWNEDEHGPIIDRLMDLYFGDELDDCVLGCYEVLKGPHARWMRVKVLLLLALCESEDMPLAMLWLEKARRCHAYMLTVYDRGDPDFRGMHAQLQRNINAVDEALLRLRLLDDGPDSVHELMQYVPQQPAEKKKAATCEACGQNMPTQATPTPSSTMTAPASAAMTESSVSQQTKQNEFQVAVDQAASNDWVVLPAGPRSNGDAGESRA